jgi:hypothetical protein
MRRIILLALAIGFLSPLLASAPAHAQATRTWVSGVGDDANPCSRTAPCKTFAGAISKTAAQGEIDCLDPGGFGGITITKAITLNCSATLGSILVAGTNGVTINAGPNDRIILRNLQLQGIGPTGGSPGLVGVKILSAAAVSIENCVITQFSLQGVSDARTGGGTKLFIRNTVISHNGAAGISLVAGATNNAVVDDTTSVNNAFGIAAATGNNAVVKRSNFSGNTTAGVLADSGGQVSVDDSAISGNGAGVQANAGNIRVSNSDINFNTGAAFSGSPVTYGNNRVLGNGSVGATTAAGSASSDLGQQ